MFIKGGGDVKFIHGKKNGGRNVQYLISCGVYGWGEMGEFSRITSFLGNYYGIYGCFFF